MFKNIAGFVGRSLFKFQQRLNLIRAILIIEKEIEKQHTHIVGGVHLIVNDRIASWFKVYNDLPGALSLFYTYKQFTVRGVKNSSRYVIILNTKAEKMDNPALAKGLFLHEYAHHSLGHTKDSTRAGTLDAEYEADDYVVAHDKDAAAALADFLDEVDRCHGNWQTAHRAKRIRTAL